MNTGWASELEIRGSFLGRLVGITHVFLSFPTYLFSCYLFLHSRRYLIWLWRQQVRSAGARSSKSCHAKTCSGIMKNLQKICSILHSSLALGLPLSLTLRRVNANKFLASFSWVYQIECVMLRLKFEKNFKKHFFVELVLATELEELLNNSFTSWNHFLYFTNLYLSFHIFCLFVFIF